MMQYYILGYIILNLLWSDQGWFLFLETGIQATSERLVSNLLILRSREWVNSRTPTLYFQDQNSLCNLLEVVGSLSLEIFKN